MSYRLQVLIPEELDARLRKAARRSGVSKGEWVRRAIHAALESPAKSDDPVASLSAIEAPAADIDVMLAEIERGRS